MLIVLAGAVLFGALKGLAWQLASLASITVSYLVAYRYREPFSQSIDAEPPWNRFLAMLLLYVGTSLVIWVAFRMLSKTIDRLKLKEFDRQVGAVFGFGKGVLYCTLITLFAVTLLGTGIRERIVRSKSGYYIAKLLDRSDLVMPPDVHEVLGPYIENFDRQVQAAEEPSSGSSGFPWTDGWTDGASSLEWSSLPERLWQGSGERPADAAQPWAAEPASSPQQATGESGGPWR